MLTHEYSQQIVKKALTMATKKNIHIAIAVVDTHGELMCFIRMNKATLQAGHLAQSKAYTSAREQQSTANLGRWAQSTNKDMGYWTDQRFTGLGGGIPLSMNNHHIGAVGVTGLSEQEDEELALYAIS